MNCTVHIQSPLLFSQCPGCQQRMLTHSVYWLICDWPFCHVQNWALQWHNQPWLYMDGSVQERRNSFANALELCLSCTNLSIWELFLVSGAWISNYTPQNTVWCNYFIHALRTCFWCQSPHISSEFLVHFCLISFCKDLSRPYFVFSFSFIHISSKWTFQVFSHWFSFGSCQKL